MEIIAKKGKRRSSHLQGKKSGEVEGKATLVAPSVGECMVFFCIYLCDHFRPKRKRYLFLSCARIHF